MECERFFFGYHNFWYERAMQWVVSCYETSIPTMFWFLASSRSVFRQTLVVYSVANVDLSWSFWRTRKHFSPLLRCACMNSVWFIAELHAVKKKKKNFLNLTTHCLAQLIGESQFNLVTFFSQIGLCHDKIIFWLWKLRAEKTVKLKNDSDSSWLKSDIRYT